MISARKLAELAGVSQSTVSRSLNDYPEISPETKERIRALAREHGYIIRKKTKKTIATDQRKAIGILLTSHKDYNDMFVDQLMNHVYRSIENENYYVIPLMDLEGESGVDRLRELVRLRIMEGFIIANRRYDTAIESYLQEIGMPHNYLLYYSKNSAESVTLVDSDNYLGGYMAAQHLLDLHHRRIITLTSSWREFEDRTAGYQAALADYGIAPDPSLILSCNRDYNACYQVVCENLALFHDATAVFAQCDQQAVGVVNALIDNGFRVPEDISVIGYDGLYFGQIVRPQISSVLLPIAEMAQTSVEQLIQIANSNASTRVQTRVYLQPTLLLRQSTAPCRES